MGFAHQDLVATRQAIGYPAMRRLLDDHGIAHVEVEFLGDWFIDGEQKRAPDALRRDLLEAAHALRGGIDIEKISRLPLQYIKSVEIDDARAEVNTTSPRSSSARSPTCSSRRDRAASPTTRSPASCSAFRATCPRTGWSPPSRPSPG